jgi:hypothetical protein
MKSTPYIEYAARYSGKTKRLCNDVLIHLIEDKNNKVFIFCMDASSKAMIEKQIYLNENLYNQFHHNVYFVTNNEMKESSKFFELNIIIGQAIQDSTVKFYFDDFEDLTYCYSTILHEFLNNPHIYERLYLTSTPRPFEYMSRQSQYQQGELNNIRTFLKHNDEMHILHIGFFNKETTH